MNPMLLEFLKSVLVRLLGYAGVWLVTQGVINQQQADAYILELAGGLALAGGTLLYGMYSRYVKRQEVLTAAASPRQVSEAEVKQLVKEGLAPSVTTPKDVVPTLTPPKVE